MKQRTFPEVAEIVLITGILVGIALVTQRSWLGLFRAGLLILVASTLLQIAVGNLPKSLAAGPSLIRVAKILALVAAVFLLGIVLVPFLAQVGR